MLAIRQVHHIAIIGSDYQASKKFYCEVLGFSLMSEVYRETRDSWKADLALNGQYTIELFPFRLLPHAPVARKHVAYGIWPFRSMILNWRCGNLKAQV